MHFIGTNVELHAAAALPTGKESRVSIGYEDQIQRAMGSEHVKMLKQKYISMHFMGTSVELHAAAGLPMGYKSLRNPLDMRLRYKEQWVRKSSKC
jgi:hypothetical protein